MNIPLPTDLRQTQRQTWTHTLTHTLQHSTMALLVTTFYHPVNHTGSFQDKQVVISKYALKNSSHVSESIIPKSNQQTQSKHKSGNPIGAENTKAQMYKLYSLKQNEDQNTCAESTHKGVN